MPSVVRLDDPGARDPQLAGAKAANLARAAGHGLPVLPGFAITTAATAAGPLVVAADEDVRAAWAEVSRDGAIPVVVRSSSTAEDLGTSSMAGQFTSILGVAGWPAFTDAVATVLASAEHPKSGPTEIRPMAVLVQRHLDAVTGGVLFGLDPVSGDATHVVAEAVAGTPDALVSGTVTAAHGVLTRRGRLVGGLSRAQRALLPAAHRRRLAQLARRAGAAFDGPQDIEWAFDGDGRLWLLQSRAVTATGHGAQAAGPAMGPGPVAETFPDALRPLEADLWVAPLRDGVVGALRVTGAVGRRRLATSPVVMCIGGRPAVDLELFGVVPGVRRSWWRALSPGPPLRRLVASWRVGRLRAALPALTVDVLAAVDGHLGAIGALPELPDTDLVTLLDRAGEELVSLHAHEVLAGILLRGQGDRSTASAVALAALADARERGLDDEHAVAEWPVILALTPPAMGAGVRLPALGAGGPGSGAPAGLAQLGSREALRLRCRWVQELGARAAWELGVRLAAAGLLAGPDLVAQLTLDELRGAVHRHVVPDDLERRAAAGGGPPLPAVFRLTPDLEPVAVAAPGAGGAGGLGAGAGRATGVVVHDPADLDGDGARVLVVPTLDPRLASALPLLAGLVSETGSALSHLAILAREMGVPTVVAVPDARRRFPRGTRVLVDGGTGEVRAEER